MSNLPTIRGSMGNAAYTVLLLAVAAALLSCHGLSSFPLPHVDVNQRPTAVITASVLTGAAPLTVEFSGAGSTDPEGDPIKTYEWTYNVNGEEIVRDTLGPAISIEFLCLGTYTVNLAVSSDIPNVLGGAGGSENSASIDIQITAGNQPPVPQLTAKIVSQDGYSTQIDFDASGSLDPDGTLTKFEWRFDDRIFVHYLGSSPLALEPMDLDSGTDPKATHHYQGIPFGVQGGETFRHATVYVTDNLGGRRSASISFADIQ